MLILPQFSPNAIVLGPLQIKWYALAYIAGLIIVSYGLNHYNRREHQWIPADAMENLLVYATFGVLLGGRLGYVAFYNPSHYWQHPLQILYIWQGGMSFHGGLFGACLAMYCFARHYHLPYLRLMDTIAIFTPQGLLWGRLANFINLELYGRVTSVPWGMVFPGAGPLPRHPSQLYEAALEGIGLSLLYYWLEHHSNMRVKYPGIYSAILLIGYGICRYIVEYFREPDIQLGYVLGHWTMGQLLTLPMILLGIYLIYQALHLSKNK